ncbi:MAG: PhoH family protein [Gammaproteobacteria bacterium]|nr:PhoH family protein [Gammaproteobacteria bacterium]
METTSEKKHYALHLTPENNQRLASLCGRVDENLKQIEKQLNVVIHNQAHQFQIVGMEKQAKIAKEVLFKLYIETEQDTQISPQKVHLFIQNAKPEHQGEVDPTLINDAVFQTKNSSVKPYNANQQRYLKNIFAHDLSFGIGPAGTGKTYLAVACAVAALEQEKVKRILLSRPAVEAGERLGFLPGDLFQKVDPYFRPLYDALYEMLGFEKVTKLIERHVIEIVPLAFMRGRTLNDSFIILDEAQNATREQMKMFLTRVGFGSIVVVTGDMTQVDLPKGQHSGLRHAKEVLKDLPGISFTLFESKDVVRHPLIQAIIQAYDREENGVS